MREKERRKEGKACSQGPRCVRAPLSICKSETGRQTNSFIENSIAAGVLLAKEKHLLVLVHAKATDFARPPNTPIINWPPHSRQLKRIVTAVALSIVPTLQALVGSPPLLARPFREHSIVLNGLAAVKAGRGLGGRGVGVSATTVATACGRGVTAALVAQR